MFDLQSARDVITTIRDAMVEKRDYLIELDSAIGDGDLGLTMSKAFSTAAEQIESLGDDDIGTFFSRAGMAMAKAAPSTMGTLVATGFMRGGKALKGKSTIEPGDVALFFRAFCDGVQERGKTKTGEKTIVDVLDPVATASEEAAGSGASFPEVAERIRAAAHDGHAAARDMMAQHGKAAIYREQTQGKDDPGATAGLVIIEGIADVLEKS